MSKMGTEDTDTKGSDKAGMDKGGEHKKNTDMDMEGTSVKGTDKGGTDKGGKHKKSTDSKGTDAKGHDDHADGDDALDWSFMHHENPEEDHTRAPTDCYKDFGPDFMDCWTGLQWECCVADDDDFFRTDVPVNRLFDGVNNNRDDPGIDDDGGAEGGGFEYNSDFRNLVIVGVVTYAIVTAVSRWRRRRSAPPLPEIVCAEYDDDDVEGGVTKATDVELRALI